LLTKSILPKLIFLCKRKVSVNGTCWNERYDTPKSKMKKDTLIHVTSYILHSLEATLINLCGIEAESLGMSTGR
jgi:hypothetical protein